MLGILLIWAASAGPVFAQLYSNPSTEGTIYYDLTNSICTESGSMTGGGTWAVGANSAVPKCEPDSGYSTYDQIGSNSIVAFNQDMVWADLGKWCGKEVQLFDPSGSQIQGPDGPFYIWESCQNCASDYHIDLSGLAWQALGGQCTGNNPSGISYKVLDNNIKQWGETAGSGGDGGGAVASEGPQSVSTAAGVSSVGIVPSPSVPQQVQSASAAPIAGACTTKGQYQCSGLTLQQCNYVSSSSQLSWQTITTACATYCDVSKVPICA